MEFLKSKPYYLSTEQITWIANKISSMNEDEKIEQLFFPLMYNSDPNYIKHLNSKYKFGGVMFRSDQASDNQNAINIIQAGSKTPLFIAANLEDGGNGVAFEGTYMGRQMLISATNDANHAERLGTICGVEGSAIGVNLSFSPVVDLDLNFRNPITNVRTYGSNPKHVLNMSRAYIKGLQEHNVFATIKHFPGDGVDERDHHLLTSVNTQSLEEWENTFGFIYRQLIDEGILNIMVGHIAMPSIEAHYENKECKQIVPASLSKNIIKRFLREELKYNGLIITDASPMVGFTSALNRSDAVPMAIEHGCDMFLFTKDLEEDIFFMKQGYREGKLSEARLIEALTRILATKIRTGIIDIDDEKNYIAKTDKDLEVLNNDTHQQWAIQCANEGVTLVKDTQQLLPISPKKHKRVLLQILGDFESNNRVYNQFEDLLVREGYLVSKYVPETLDTIFINGKVEEFKKSYDLVIYIGNIENASNKTVSRIHWHTLFGAGNNIPWFVNEVPTLFISVGNPYHLFDVPMIKTYINGYCHAPTVVDSIFQKLIGKSEFVGESPIDPFCGVWDTKM